MSDIKTKEQYEKKYGTPSEFKHNIWSAYSNCEISLKETQLAIDKYLLEWASFPDEKDLANKP